MGRYKAPDNQKTAKSIKNYNKKDIETCILYWDQAKKHVKYKGGIHDGKFNGKGILYRFRLVQKFWGLKFLTLSCPHEQWV